MGINYKAEFGPYGWDLGFKAGIQNSRPFQVLRQECQSRRRRKRKDFSIYESVGYGSLWGRCPKGKQRKEKKANLNGVKKAQMLTSASLKLKGIHAR